MRNEPLDNKEHVARYVKPTQQNRDDDGHCIGIAWHAFDLRPDESYVSLNVLERADADRARALAIIRDCLSAKMKISKNGVITTGNVGGIRAVFGSHRIKLASEPTTDEPSYGTMRNLPIERRVALEKLATSAWCDWKYQRDC